MPERILTRCASRAGLAALVFLAGFAGCGGRDQSPADSAAGKHGQRPAVVDLLELMPESAATAIATPSIRDLGENVESFLLRASPESINMEAEIRVVIQQMGRAVGVPNARSLDDIAFECGIDAERPFAVFFAADHRGIGIEQAEVAEEVPDLDVPFREPLPPYFAAESMDSLAVAAYVLDAEVAEQAIRRVLGEPEFFDGDATTNGIRMHVTKGNEWGYFIHDGLLVAGGYEIIGEIDRRLREPVAVRYGSEDCPADPADSLVQLTRLDLLGRAQALAQDGASSAMPPQLSAPLSDAINDLRALADGPDPLLCIYRVTEDFVNVVARLDREQHPMLADWRGARRGLPQLAMVPDDSVAVLSWDFGGKMRELTIGAIESALASEGSADNPLMPGQDTIHSLLELLDGNMTISIINPERGDPAALILANVLDGDRARTQFRASGLMPLVSETYNGTDICLLPVPIPVGDGVCYALPGNTFVLSTSLGRLKSTIDAVAADRTTGWAAKQTPALNPSDPLLTALVIKPGPLADTLVPQLEAQAAVDAEHAATAELIWENIQEVRYTARVNGAWQEGLLTVTVK